MIKAEEGKVAFRGIKSHVMAETVTVLRALKKVVSEEEYKMVIGLADKSEKQIEDEMREMKEELKKLLGL